MEKDMELLIGYLEFSYEEFYQWLEKHREIEGVEAERIIAELKRAYSWEAGE